MFEISFHITTSHNLLLSTISLWNEKKLAYVGNLIGNIELSIAFVPVSMRPVKENLIGWRGNIKVNVQFNASTLIECETAYTHSCGEGNMIFNGRNIRKPRLSFSLALESSSSSFIKCPSDGKSRTKRNTKEELLERQNIQ